MPKSDCYSGQGYKSSGGKVLSGQHTLTECYAEAVPRHVEISNALARKICQGLSVPEIA